MKVSQLGQFGLIDRIAALIEAERDNQAESWQKLVHGVGDDCAVWQGDPSNQLAKIDCQVQGVHFNLDIISWEDLGWKALAVNLSDIAAMGGIPLYALVSLGLPLDTESEDVLSLYRGMLKLAKLSGVAVTGGNVSGAPFIFIDVSLIGRSGHPSGAYLSRSSARPGDSVAVTGSLGTAAAGLQMLTRKLDFDQATRDCLRQAFARPEPRLAEGRLFLSGGVKTGMDISDGLFSDLGHICRASGVGAVIEAQKIPIKAEVKAAFGAQALDLALSGGEDYQLLITAPAAVIEAVRKTSAYPVTVIGRMVSTHPGEVRVVGPEGDPEGGLYRPESGGWDHFKSKR